MRDRDAINILLIEDDPNDVFMLKRALAETSTFSFHVSQADCLSAGLDILDKGEVDVVLLDLNLPDSRGLDTLKTLRHHTTQVPVVVMSRLLDDELAVKAIRLGAQEFLLKKRTDGQTITRIINYAIERHRLHHDLEISEGHIRSIIANNLDGILIVDNEGLVHFTNHAAELIFGRSAAQLVGETFGFPVSVGVSELEIWQRDAPSLFVEMQSAAIDWDGKPAYLASLRNITDRKLAEEARREAEHKLNKMLQSLVDGAVVVDLSGKITYANPAAESILAIPKAKIIGNYYYSGEWKQIDANRILYPLDQLPLAIVLREQREVMAVEHGFITRGGETKWLSVNASPLLDEKGQLYGAIASFRDVTEPKRVAEALAESHKQIALQASLLDQVRNAVVAIDLDGKIFYWNKFAEVLYQWKAEEAIGKSAREVIVPEEGIRLADETLKLLQQNGYWEGEYIVRRKDGSRFPVQVVNTVIRDAGGTVIGFVGVSIDITERKRAEQEIGSLAKFPSENPNPVLRLSRDGILMYANGASGALLDMLGCAVGGTAPQFWCDLANKALSSRDNTTVEIEWDGKVYSMFVTPVTEPGYVNFYMSDITERKQAEEKLIASETRYRRLFEAAQDGIILLDADTGEIFDVNPYMVKLLGYSVEEFLGKKLWEIGAFKDVSANQLAFSELRENEFIRYQDLPLQSKDGRLKDVEFVSNVYLTGKHKVVQCNVRDIAERKRAEETIRHSRDLLELTGQLANIGGWELDLETQVLTWTDEVYRIHEVDPATQLDVAEAINFYAPEARPVISAAVQAGIDSGTAWDLELPLITAQGRHIWVRAQGTAERRGSKTVRLNGVFQDITERKLAEEEIRTRTKELKMLYELSRALADANNLNQVLDIVNHCAVENVHITFSRMALLEGNDLLIRAAYPLRFLDHDLLVGDHKPIADLPNCRRILEGHDPVMLHASDPTVGHEECTTLLLDHVYSLALMPLRVEGIESVSGYALGMLMLGEARNEGREPITLQKLDLIRSIGDQAASAIRRMLLKAETRWRLEHLSALSEIDKAITSGFDLKANLKTCIAQVIKQLMVDAADVLLFDSSQQILEYFCGEGFRTKAIEGTRLRLGESHAGRAALERIMVHVSNLQNPGNFLITPNLIDENFVSYFGVPLIAKGKIKGVLEIFHRTLLRPVDEWLEFLNAIAGQAAIAVDNAMLFSELNQSTIELTQAYNETIEGWSRALDLRDRETEGHSIRVTNNALILARSFGLNQDELEQFRWGALLHDIGKMGVPDGILLKPGPLTDEEWVLMRKHPTLAYELLSPIQYLRLALDIPYCHHEKWDGTGYPRDLKGDQIPLAARIFAIVDVWDALRSDRPYRPAWPEEKVLAQIQSLAGNHLDPRVVETFLRIRDEITD